MIRFLWIICLVLIGLSSCASLKQPVVSQTTAQEPLTSPEKTSSAVAQAQTSEAEAALPALTQMPDVSTSEALKSLETKKNTKPDGLASTNRKIVSAEWKKPLGLSKAVFKIAEKQVLKTLKKRRPSQQDGTILGLEPILFFSLLAVLVGIILLFVAGKSQFFSILTVTLLIGGLLLALASFLDII